MNTSLQQSLLDRGYTRYNNQAFGRGTDILFQKAVKDEKGIKYYINCWYYPEYSYGRGVYVAPVPETLQGEVNFRLKNAMQFIVTSFCKDIEQLELQMEEVWSKMDCTYNTFYVYTNGEELKQNQ